MLKISLNRNLNEKSFKVNFFEGYFKILSKILTLTRWMQIGFTFPQLQQRVFSPIPAEHLAERVDNQKNAL